jgi:hypothetical protein
MGFSLFSPPKSGNWVLSGRKEEALPFTLYLFREVSGKNILCLLSKVVLD